MQELRSSDYSDAVSASLVHDLLHYIALGDMVHHPRCTWLDSALKLHASVRRMWTPRLKAHLDKWLARIAKEKHAEVLERLAQLEA